MPKSLLALDVATVTGFAFGQIGEPPKADSIRFGAKNATDDECWAAATKWLVDFLKVFTPDVVALEAPIMSSSAAGGTNPHPELRLPAPATQRNVTMPGDLNRATIIGRLGKDPELRAMGNGKTVATFSVATSDKWKDKDSGQDKETTEWHRVTCFRESTVRFLEHYVKKGDQVYVEGAIKTRKWQAQDGSDRYSTEIVITDFNGNVQKLGGAGQGTSNRDESSYGSTRDRAPRESSGGAPAGGFGGGMGDDIPFYPEWR